MLELINFTSLSGEQKLMVLKWRNDERIAKFMKNKSVGKEEHFAFLERLKSIQDKIYFLVNDKAMGEFIGVISFVDITKQSCEFGVYKNPELKGVGKKLLDLIKDYAFFTLKVGLLKAKAYNSNKKALALYENFGFRVYAKDDDFSYLELKNETD
ncbi:UDP-4-amino-4,6-dideoxy-N-acetyl-beta-L-altrosamine N-acetyltransferase [Campylobacter concisus]|uniref:UDP-4-amino-4, 6-dideoxy-N-acetyl-beta-L-altrosamine N-acetyltransferase n=1 Tax=Campylobacter concisus TaxID=199 RepID=UPI0018848290|nr:UDP-4-amino-4,6-dideoxy-N-acetyl-beta-L-altrosamine N-acetyltransferase [Campylobacter concisus]MBE9864130.1 UDP-4-amino-4,6-dideoxy-N-acetyl-beta-L-altrosamine N-acetyltransferase [Campylobacter concisus]